MSSLVYIWWLTYTCAPMKLHGGFPKVNVWLLDEVVDGCLTAFSFMTDMLKPSVVTFTRNSVKICTHSRKRSWNCRHSPAACGHISSLIFKNLTWYLCIKIRRQNQDDQRRRAEIYHTASWALARARPAVPLGLWSITSSLRGNLYVHRLHKFIKWFANNDVAHRN